MEPSRTEESSGDPVEELLAACLALSEEERPTALEQACERHPELAAELRQRWRALVAMGLDGGTPSAEDAPRELGDFRLLERLGAGGMGIVYRAEQRSLGRVVALKLMRPEGLYFPQARERFRREAEAVARLKHPGLVPVHAVGEEQGIPYFAMELLEGATLADVLAALAGRAPEELSGQDLAAAVGAPPEARRAGVFALPWTQACVELARQVAEALQHAHDKGFLHRDVKPSNVALSRDGRAQLFDFGLAVSEASDRLTRTGGQLGTLHYMAPEQLRGERDLDRRADVYALGATLYELLTLTPPYEGATRPEVESRILAGRPRALRLRNRKVPPELELVCAKALEPERSRRYADARALADDLQRVLERRPVLARPPSAWLRARRWTQRHPALAVGLLAAVALFGVAPSVLLWRERLHSAELRQVLEQETRALAAERSARAAEQAALEAERAALAETRASVVFLEELFVAVDPYRGGDPDARVRDVLERGATALAALEGPPRLQGRLALSLAAGFAAHGLFAEALPLAERSLAIELELDEPLVVRDDRPVEVVATCLGALGRDAEAEPLLRAALEDERDPERRARLSFALGRLALDLGRLEEAVDLLGQAHAYYSENADGETDGREPRMAIGFRLSNALHQLGRDEDSLQAAEESLALARELFAPEHPAVAEGLSRSAFARMGLGQADAALEAQSRAVLAIEAFYGAGSYADARFRQDLANLLAQAGEPGEAARVADEVVAACERLFGPTHPRTAEMRRIARAYRARAGR